MTPWQAAVGVVGAVWVGWLVARLLLLWSRVARQGMARAVAPGRPTLRLEFPPSVWLEIMEGPRLGWRRRCRKCWWRVARQADHLIPAARGGHNDASNGAPLCRACNRGKSDRLEVWAVARWVTPWVGWSFPVPTPVMLAAAIVVVAVLMRGGAL